MDGRPFAGILPARLTTAGYSGAPRVRTTWSCRDGILPSRLRQLPSRHVSPAGLHSWNSGRRTRWWRRDMLGLLTRCRGRHGVGWPPGGVAQARYEFRHDFGMIGEKKAAAGMWAGGATHTPVRIASRNGWQMGLPGCSGSRASEKARSVGQVDGGLHRFPGTSPKEGRPVDTRPTLAHLRWALRARRHRRSADRPAARPPVVTGAPAGLPDQV